MKRHDLVIGTWARAPIGRVLRVGKGWIDVEWYSGIGLLKRKRVLRSCAMKLKTLEEIGLKAALVELAEAAYDYGRSVMDLPGLDEGVENCSLVGLITQDIIRFVEAKKNENS